MMVPSTPHARITSGSLPQISGKLDIGSLSAVWLMKHSRAYTRVLQGHIAVAEARFPAGTTGSALDALARAPLWKDGYDFRHGTGHGIGSFLNVHEGPQRISSVSTEPLRAGQMVSNEPGFYEVGEFGIRIESIYLVSRAETCRGFGGANNWLGLERITQVRQATRCREMLN